MSVVNYTTFSHKSYKFLVSRGKYGNKESQSQQAAGYDSQFEQSISFPIWIILVIMLSKTRIMQTEKPDTIVAQSSGFSVIIRAL